MVTVYYSERTKIAIIKKEKAPGAQKTPRESFQLSPSKSPKFSQQGHVTSASIAKQEGHLGAGFSLGLSHTGMEHRVADLSYSVSSHLGGQTDRTWPKTPAINGIVSIDCVARLKAPGNPRLSLLLGKTILFPGDLPRVFTASSFFATYRVWASKPAELTLYCTI